MSHVSISSIRDLVGNDDPHFPADSLSKVIFAALCAA